VADARPQRKATGPKHTHLDGGLTGRSDLAATWRRIPRREGLAISVRGYGGGYVRNAWLSGCSTPEQWAKGPRWRVTRSCCGLRRRWPASPPH